MFSKFTIFVDKFVRIHCEDNSSFVQNPEYLRSIDLIHELNRYFFLLEAYQPPKWLTIEQYGRIFKILSPRGSWSEGNDFLEDSKKASRVECVLRLSIPTILRISLSVFTKGDRKPICRHEIAIARSGGCSISTYST